MTLQGRRPGTACWLAGVVTRPLGELSPTHANCRKPALERLARHSLFDRYMKAQLRLVGGRRKLGRNGLTSDIPREGADPPEYLRDLRDLNTFAAKREATWEKKWWHVSYGP